MALAALGTGIINIGDRGPIMALVGLGSVNPIVWFTLFAAAAITFEAEYDQPLRQADIWVLVATFSALVPVVSVGSCGVFLASD